MPVPRRTRGRITLSPSAARRLARVVADVERGDGDITPPTIRTSSGDDALARGTFTLPWSKGSTKTVTDAVLSSVTYEAKNYFASLTGTGTKACAIAYVAGEWILIAAEC